MTFSLSPSDVLVSIVTAGDAGIVLNLFLPSASPALRSDDGVGLVVVRGAVLVAVRGLAAVDVLLFFGGLAAVNVLLFFGGLAAVVVLLLFDGLNGFALPAGLLSGVGEGWIVARLSGVVVVGFETEVRLAVLPDSDIRFAGFPRLLFFFSSPDAPDLPPSSPEASDGRDL